MRKIHWPNGNAIIKFIDSGGVESIIFAFSTLSFFFVTFRSIIVRGAVFNYLAYSINFTIILWSGAYVLIKNDITAQNKSKISEKLHQLELRLEKLEKTKEQ